MMHEREIETPVDAATLMPKLAQFAAVAESEHMTNAAAALGVPQPTVSRSLARLEAELGTQLFVRQGRSVRLTPAGRTFAHHVARAIDEITAGIAQTLDSVDPGRGRVAFGFPLTMGGDTVPRVVRDFHRQHPRVSLDLMQGSGEDLLDALRGNRIDLTLLTPPPAAPEIESITVQYQYLRLLVPRGHRLADQRRVRLAEVRDEPFVGFPDSYWISAIIRGLCDRAGFTPSVVFRSRESETIRGLVTTGLGVAVMPPTAARWPGVAELELVDADAYREIGLVWLRDRTLPPPVALFRDFIVSRRHQFSGGPPGKDRLSPR
ncbi:hypothetical protein ASG12_01345 [Williamsia sp. Leaf354]|uniref:LysR family transcriptional regulator n=1 Tax=Williamsia sp. Leaf354 TaxID=1736349 RepID=UPI0006FA8C48|nr:LysR family transcriptional regulator [Williamsia sp. Leaf354]KQR99499.1 hypothetical protein ASG12_01345 [Williamsia sp. Leaf354]